MNWNSGARFSMRKNARSFIRNRNRPRRSARRQKYIRMIRVRAEAAKNIKNAAAKINNRQQDCFRGQRAKVVLAWPWRLPRGWNTRQLAAGYFTFAGVYGSDTDGRRRLPTFDIGKRWSKRFPRRICVAKQQKPLQIRAHLPEALRKRWFNQRFLRSSLRNSLRCEH